jgi:hypothetical protein
VRRAGLSTCADLLVRVPSDPREGRNAARGGMERVQADANGTRRGAYGLITAGARTKRALPRLDEDDLRIVA